MSFGQRVAGSVNFEWAYICAHVVVLHSVLEGLAS